MYVKYRIKNIFYLDRTDNKFIYKINFKNNYDHRDSISSYNFLSRFFKFVKFHFESFNLLNMNHLNIYISR